MNDSGRRPVNRRTRRVGPLIAVVGVTLSAVVAAVFLLVNFAPFAADPGIRSTTQEDPASTRENQPVTPEAPASARQEVQALPPEGGFITQEVQLVGVLPSPRIVKFDTPGDSQQISVEGYYSDDSLGELEDGRDGTLSYASSDPAVAQVDSGGLVTAMKKGGADIVVSYAGFESTVTVMVWGPVKSIPAIDPNRLLEIASDGTALVLHRLMVELQPGYGPTDAGQLASGIGGEVVLEYSTFPGYLIDFDGRTSDDLEGALAALRADPRVAWAHPDLLVPASGGGTKDIETLTNKSSGYLDAGMEDAWAIMNRIDSSDLEPVVIAIIDNGFPATLEYKPPFGPVNEATLGSNIKRVIAREFDYEKIKVMDMVDGPEQDFHGVAVASVIAAENNTPSLIEPDSHKEMSFSGVVTSVGSLEYDLVIFEVGTPIGTIKYPEFTNSLSAIQKGLEDIFPYGKQVDVVNLSIGMRCIQAKDNICEDGWREKFKENLEGLLADMQDITFVVAAGNEEEDVGALGYMPAEFSTLDNVITVGGVEDDRRAGYNSDEGSSFGDAITLGAPFHVWLVDIDNDEGYGTKGGGTSYAAPLVTGTVALLRALNPDLSPREIKDILRETGTTIHVCNEDILRVRECPDESKDTWEKLDAGAAVRKVLSDFTAEIDGPDDDPITALPRTNVPLEITVKNTGPRPWTFHAEAVVISPDGQEHNKPPPLHTGKTYDYYRPVSLHIPKGGSDSFTLDLGGLNEPGFWTVEVMIYRFSEEADPGRIPAAVREFNIQVGPPQSVSRPTATSMWSVFPRDYDSALFLDLAEFRERGDLGRTGLLEAQQFLDALLPGGGLLFESFDYAAVAVGGETPEILMYLQGQGARGLLELYSLGAQEARREEYRDHSTILLGVAGKELAGAALGESLLLIAVGSRDAPGAALRTLKTGLDTHGDSHLPRMPDDPHVAALLKSLPPGPMAGITSECLVKTVDGSTPPGCDGTAFRLRLIGPGGPTIGGVAAFPDVSAATGALQRLRAGLIVGGKELVNPDVRQEGGVLVFSFPVDDAELPAVLKQLGRAAIGAGRNSGSVANP